MQRLALALLAGFIAPSLAVAAELDVVTSGGGLAALHALASSFQHKTGNTLHVVFGPSMGGTPDTIPARLARHEPIDAVLMVGSALQKLVDDHQVESKVDVARSLMGAAVKQGVPHPDVSTADALRATLLATRSVAVSDSASGVYLTNQGFGKLGIAEQMKGKTHVVPATPVGEEVAKGQADLGFQQIAELKPVAGIELLGPLPAEIQLVTMYSAGVVDGAPHKAAAEELVRFLASPAAAEPIRSTGLEPVNAKGE